MSYGPTFGDGFPDIWIQTDSDKNTNSIANLGNCYNLPSGMTFGSTQA